MITLRHYMINCDLSTYDYNVISYFLGILITTTIHLTPTIMAEWPGNAEMCGKLGVGECVPPKTKKNGDARPYLSAISGYLSQRVEVQATDAAMCGVIDVEYQRAIIRFKVCYAHWRLGRWAECAIPIPHRMHHQFDAT